MLDLLLTYYHYYIYMICAFAGSGLACMLYSKQHAGNEKSVFLFSLRLFLYIIGDMSIALIFKHHFDDLVLCPFSFLSGALIVPVVRITIIIVLKLKLHVNESNIMGIGTFIYLFINQLIYPHCEIDEWQSAWYAVDYSMGFSSRFFIGTIMTIICGDYIPAEFVVNFCHVVDFGIIVLVSILVNSFYGKCNINSRLGFCFMLAMFLSSPCSIIGLWQKRCFGRLEVHCLLICLLCLLLYVKFGLNLISSSIITILSIVSMAIYQGNVFMYYALVLMIYIWECYKAPKRFCVWCYALINLLVTSFSFLYFQFYSFCIFNSASEMAEAIRLRTDLVFNEKAIDYECFQSLKVAFEDINIQYITFVYIRERAFLTVLLLTPIIILYISLYKRCLTCFRERHGTILKSIYVYYIALVMIITPQFILNVDWGRWLISMTIVLFFGFAFLIWKEDEIASISLVYLSSWIKRHKVISILAVLFVSGLDKMDPNAFIGDQVGVIVRWLTMNQWLLPV